MNESLKQQLLAALKATRPDIGKDYLYERCVNKYVEALIPAMRDGIARTQTATGEFYVSQMALREQIGTIGKRQEYIYYLMNAHPSTALIHVTMQGFRNGKVGRLSSAIINPRYKEQVIQALTTNPPIQHTANIDAESNYTVAVDIDSLHAYITQTRRTLDSMQGNGAYQKKLFRNLNAAVQLLGLVQSPNAHVSTHYLNEQWWQSDSGRFYGQGLSLQCTAKEVRHAALGVCHKYDFKACAFALMASLAHEINPTLRLGAVLDYIKRRHIIRKQIAKQVGIDESLVKTIFTAIGFGAELHNNPYKSIRAALAEAARQAHAGNERLDSADYQQLGEVEYQKLTGNQIFAYIYEEFQAINATILAYFNDQPLVIDDLVYSATDPKTGKKRSSRQKLAWIYQALESKALLQFVDLCQQAPLLTTHDCVYLKQKLSANQILDITTQLQDTFQYLRFEHEAIYPITTQSHFQQRTAEHTAFLKSHAENIRNEELKALDWMDERLSQQKPLPYIQAINTENKNQ